jgi:hypothetical protein
MGKAQTAEAALPAPATARRRAGETFVTSGPEVLLQSAVDFTNVGLDNA